MHASVHTFFKWNITTASLVLNLNVTYDQNTSAWRIRLSIVAIIHFCQICEVPCPFQQRFPLLSGWTQLPFHNSFSSHVRFSVLAIATFVFQLHFNPWGRLVTRPPTTSCNANIKIVIVPECSLLYWFIYFLFEYEKLSFTLILVHAFGPLWTTRLSALKEQIARKINLENCLF